MPQSKRRKKKAGPAQHRVPPVGRDLQAVHRFAVDLLAEHGLSDWSVFWTYSMPNDAGGGVTYAHTNRIVFSAGHLAILSREDRYDAVRHEVAHALVGVAAGHSDVWKSKAIELGGTGTTSLTPHGRLYPWAGLCPDGHAVASLNEPGAPDFICRDNSHEQPVPIPIERTVKNPMSRALDPGVTEITETYPEPASVPMFGVGDSVSVIPFGSEEFDDLPLIVLEVGERDYLVRRLDTREELHVGHEMVAERPEQ